MVSKLFDFIASITSYGRIEYVDFQHDPIGSETQIALIKYLHVHDAIDAKECMDMQFIDHNRITVSYYDTPEAVGSNRSTPQLGYPVDPRHLVQFTRADYNALENFGFMARKVEFSIISLSTVFSQLIHL